MQLIDFFDKKAFKDKNLADAVEALLKLQPRYEKENNMISLQGHLMGYAQTFRNDEPAIMSIIQKYQDKAGKKIVKSKPRQEMVFKDTSGEHGSIDEFNDKCLDCGKDKKEPEYNDDLEGFDIKKLSSVKTWRDIMNVFASDIGQMQEYIKMEIGKTTKVKDVPKLAKQIFKHLENEGLLK